MNLRTTRRYALSVAAMATAAAIALAGCSRVEEAVEASPGITDTTIKLGISSPLSGPTAGPGTCTVAGWVAYFGARNEEGGVTFGDGETRTVEIVYRDDEYSPDKAVANYRELVDQEEVFAIVGDLGTPTNLAIRPLANDEGVPHVMLLTGATAFSANQEEFPWTLAFLPTYFDEGLAFGQLLVDSGEELTVGTLVQNDDFGFDYLDGLKAAIEGSDVTIVAEATYEVGDPSVDAQITEIAASGADIMFSANSQSNLQIGALLKAQELGWFPRWFLPSNTASKPVVLDPGNAAAYEHVYSTTYQKGASPESTDPEVIKYLEDMTTYASDITTTYLPHCAWMYAAAATLEEAFANMKEPTRESLMEAIHSIEGFDPPMLLDGVTVDATDLTRPPLSDVFITEFDFGTGAYAQTDSF